MLRLFKTLFITLVLFGTAQAQTALKVSGKIVLSDSTDASYSTVVLCRLPDSTVVKAISTGEDGKFEFAVAERGNYLVYAQMVSYRRAYSSTLMISESQPTQVVNLTLIPSNATLMTVEISAEIKKLVIEQKPGMTVLNVENSVLSSGVSALEVLKRAPGVTVSNEGDVRLKGKAGVMVMLNGKATYMQGTELANLLKSLPADMVGSIEIMTLPSSKYDAAGNAGALNIVLKKAALEGLRGTATASYGQGFYPKANGGVNISYRKDKLSIAAGLQYNFAKNYTSFGISRIRPVTDSLPTNFNSGTTETEPQHLSNANFQLDYNFNERTSFSLNLLGNYTNARGVSSGNSKYFTPDGALTSEIRTDGITLKNQYNFNSNFSVKHSYDTSGSTVSASVGYRRLGQANRQNLTSNYFDSSQVITSPALLLSSEIPTIQDQANVSVDISHNFRNDWTLEAGVKYNVVKTDNNNQTTFTQGSSSKQDNHFIYTEHIAAAYAQVAKSYKKWKFNLGLRVEYTNTKGQQLSIDSTFTRSYINPFPSAAIQFSPTAKTSIQLSYARRIDRPNYNNVNPFRYYSDPLNSYSGNPFLLPQYTDNVELSLSLLEGAFFITANYSHTAKPITDIWRVSGDNLGAAYTFDNFGSFQNAGLSLAVNIPVTKWWTTSNFLYGYFNRAVGNSGLGTIVNQAYSFSFNSTQSFKLPWGLALEVSGGYDSPVAYGQMVYTHLGQLSAGIQKKFLQDRLTLRISGTDFFWSYNWRGKGKTGDVNLRDSYRWDNRVFFFTLTYNFGKSYRADNDSEEESIIQRGGGGRR
jgi:hypothetical protein